MVAKAIEHAFGLKKLEVRVANTENWACIEREKQGRITHLDVEKDPIDAEQIWLKRYVSYLYHVLEKFDPDYTNG